MKTTTCLLLLSMSALAACGGVSDEECEDVSGADTDADICARKAECAGGEPAAECVAEAELVRSGAEVAGCEAEFAALRCCTAAISDLCVDNVVDEQCGAEASAALDCVSTP